MFTFISVSLWFLCTKDKKDKACRHVITVNGAITRVGENVVLAHFSLFLVSFSNALQKCIASGRHFPN